MATEGKIAANRKNAQLSTGPKSKRGKSKSSGNATKHGVYSTKTLLRGEDEEIYEALRAEQRRRFTPQTFIEKALVDQLVIELWRLRRISRAEYLLALEIQKDLGEFEPMEFTEKETKLIRAIGDDTEQVPTIDGRSISQKQYRRLKRKIGRIDEVYSDLFLDSSHEKTQRLILLKRQVIQTILGLERELEQRKFARAREIKVSSPSPD